MFESHDTMHRVRRFLVVGIISTLLDITSFTALRIQLGLPTPLANTIAYSMGIVISYILHRSWTFTDRPRKALGTQISQFMFVSLSALVMNNFLVLLLVTPFGMLLAHSDYGDILAKVCATGVGMCWNFLANNFWTFRTASQRARR